MMNNKRSFAQKPGHIAKLKKSVRTEFLTLKKRTCLGKTGRMATLGIQQVSYAIILPTTAIIVAFNLSIILVTRFTGMIALFDRTKNLFNLKNIMTKIIYLSWNPYFKLLYIVRQQNFLFSKLNKTHCMNQKIFICFLYCRHIHKVLFYLLLKIKSGRWSPPFSIHWVNRFLAFVKTLASIAGVMLAMSSWMLVFKSCRVLGWFT